MKNYEFNAQEVADKLVLWLRDYFNNNGNPINAVIGISGGKDSTVVAAALVKAIGANRVYGVLMPNGEQKDISDSYSVCGFLGLTPYVCNINSAYNGLIGTLNAVVDVSQQAKINAAPMMRMAMLKAFSQSVNGRFTCNANLSEIYLGWFTLGGDDQGSVKPLANLTATEVALVGKALGLPDWAVFKKPTDGLWGVTDEEKFGFSYAVLDRYIRTGECDDSAIKEKIDTMHRNSRFKVNPMPEFNPFTNDR
jgi:NAD+ synthase